jgi:hypothetical protein
MLMLKNAEKLPGLMNLFEAVGPTRGIADIEVKDQISFWSGLEDRAVDCPSFQTDCVLVALAHLREHVQKTKDELENRVYAMQCTITNYDNALAMSLAWF